METSATNTPSARFGKWENERRRAIPVAFCLNGETCAIVAADLKMSVRNYRRPIGLLVVAIACCAPPSAFAADSLFADPVVAKAKGFQIHESDLQQAYVEHKAAAAAVGQPTPPALETKL